MIAFHQPFNSLSSSYNRRIFTNDIWKPHFHKNLELIYVISGEVSCTLNNRSYILKKEEFGLCLPYDIHSYTPSEGSRYCVCVFSGDYVNSFLRRIQGKTGNFIFKCSDNVRAFFLKQIIENKKASFLMQKACFYAICSEYADNAVMEKINTKKLSPMTKIVDYVSKNYKQNITLNEIAEMLGYDYHYTSRLFKSIFNMSFKDFLNTYRLDSAVILLHESDKKILDIAYESGFQSVRNLNSCFYKHFKLSPTDFKAMLHENTPPVFDNFE